MYQSAAELNNLNHWISIRVDMLGIILVGLCVGLAVFWKEGGVSKSAAGLMVSNCFQILLILTASAIIFGDNNVRHRLFLRLVDEQLMCVCVCVCVCVCACVCVCVCVPWSLSE